MARLKTKIELLEKINRGEGMTVLIREIAKIGQTLRISSDSKMTQKYQPNWDFSCRS
jgi:hypothetical protein